jgi:hypothetical protein
VLNRFRAGSWARLDKWLPLGGHVELDEVPEQAALVRRRGIGPASAANEQCCEMVLPQSLRGGFRSRVTEFALNGGADPEPQPQPASSMSRRQLKIGLLVLTRFAGADPFRPVGQLSH